MPTIFSSAARGCLSPAWLDEAGIRQTLNASARRNGAHHLEYGNPFGDPPLREQLSRMLAALGVAADAGQILLTNGTSQALNPRSATFCGRATPFWSTTPAITICTAV